MESKWPFFISVVLYLLGGVAIQLAPGQPHNLENSFWLLGAYVIGGLPALLYVYGLTRRRTKTTRGEG